VEPVCSRLRPTVLGRSKRLHLRVLCVCLRDCHARCGHLCLAVCSQTVSGQWRLCAASLGPQFQAQFQAPYSV